MAPEANSERDYLDELGGFLDSEEAPLGCMLLSELDGFLTGVVVGPESVPQSEWMAEIWNGQEAVFRDEQQATEVTAAILRRFEDIRKTLKDGEWTISPIFWESDEDGTIAEDWAEGFMAAVRLRFDAWDPLFLSPKDSDVLIPVLALCRDEDGEPFLPEPDRTDKLLKAVPQLIPEAVADIFDYWREKALTPQPIRKVITAGRNDACPCGSGKKFKRCCGA
jgi:uncharacterized protein